jgi:alpha-tubulin suppressor-like RCC1 family protein
VVGVAAGGNHSLALTSDGTVVAWGRNIEGQCTVPANLSLKSKFKVPGKMVTPVLFQLLLN